MFLFPSITVSELYYGAYKSQRVDQADNGDEQYEALQTHQGVEARQLDVNHKRLGTP